MTPSLEHRSRVRVGLVGAGFVARAHTIAFASLAPVLGGRAPSIVRQRIADVDPERARDASVALEWGSWTADWREVVEAADIDLVDIVTPNDSHAEIAVAAARAGKGVICEKPLASEPRSARAMCAAATEAGVLNVVAFVYRNWPAMALAKRLVDQGGVGEITRFRGAFLHDWALDPEVPIGWRFSRVRAGAGALGDIGSHLIDLARFMAGDVRRVMARSATLISERPAEVIGGRAGVDVDDLTDLWIEFHSGATGCLELNWASCGSKTDIRFEIVGTRGAIRFSWDRPWELSYYSESDHHELKGFRQIVLGPHHPGADLFWPVAGHGLGWADAFTLLLCRALAPDASRGPAPSFADGLATAEVVAAAQRSAIDETWEEVTEASASSAGSP